MNLEKIEKSLFVLCLDESPLEYPCDQQKSLADPDYTVTSREMLHGGGTKSNSGNRWFDKVFQVMSWDSTLRSILLYRLGSE